MLEYYSIFNDFGIEESTPVKKVEESTPIFALPDIQDITLAQYNPITKDIITAHYLKDYRRHTFRLLLLPDVKIVFDSVLEGDGYYGRFL